MRDALPDEEECHFHPKKSGFRLVIVKVIEQSVGISPYMVIRRDPSVASRTACGHL
jgi:hypothetical protein